jgi:hypothetical protein
MRLVQRRAGSTRAKLAASRPSLHLYPSVLRGALDSHSQSLPDGTRADLEPRFGHDFSRVRIHAGAAAARASRAVGARAFTVENDIVFGEGQYDPHSASGHRLLAHELTHVVQQRGAGVVQRQPVANAADIERETKEDQGEPKPDEAPGAGSSFVRTLSGRAGFSSVVSVSEDVAEEDSTGEPPPISAARDPAAVSVGGFSIVAPDHASEREAEAVSEAIAAGGAAPPIVAVGRAARGLIQRQVYWDERTNGALTWADYTAKAPVKDPKVVATQWDSVSKVGIPEMLPTASVKGSAYPPGNPAACEVGGKKTVQFKAAAGYDVDSIKVRAIMYPAESWVRDTTKTDSLLAHEQGHFDIAHVIAEKIKACILPMATASTATVLQCGAEEAGDAATKAFLKQDQGDAMLSVWRTGTALMLKIQDDYDAETDHSRKKPKQAAWLKAIVDGLPKYPLSCTVPATKKP